MLQTSGQPFLAYGRGCANSEHPLPEQQLDPSSTTWGSRFFSERQSSSPQCTNESFDSSTPSFLNEFETEAEGVTEGVERSGAETSESDGGKRTKSEDAKLGLLCSGCSCIFLASFLYWLIAVIFIIRSANNAANDWRETSCTVIDTNCSWRALYPQSDPETSCIVWSRPRELENVGYSLTSNCKWVDDKTFASLPAQTRPHDLLGHDDCTASVESFVDLYNKRVKFSHPDYPSHVWEFERTDIVNRTMHDWLDLSPFATALAKMIGASDPHVSPQQIGQMCHGIGAGPGCENASQLTGFSSLAPCWINEHNPEQATLNPVRSVVPALSALEWWFIVLFILLAVPVAYFAIGLPFLLLVMLIPTYEWIRDVLVEHSGEDETEASADISDAATTEGDPPRDSHVPPVSRVAASESTEIQFPHASNVPAVSGSRSSFLLRLFKRFLCCRTNQQESESTVRGPAQHARALSAGTVHVPPGPSPSCRGVISSKSCNLFESVTTVLFQRVLLLAIFAGWLCWIIFPVRFILGTRIWHEAPPLTISNESCAWACSCARACRARELEAAGYRLTASCRWASQASFASLPHQDKQKQHSQNQPPGAEGTGCYDRYTHHMELTSREHPEAVYKFDSEEEHPTMAWKIQQPYPGLSKTVYTIGEICENLGNCSDMPTLVGTKETGFMINSDNPMEAVVLDPLDFEDRVDTHVAWVAVWIWCGFTGLVLLLLLYRGTGMACRASRGISPHQESFQSFHLRNDSGDAPDAAGIPLHQLPRHLEPPHASANAPDADSDGTPGHPGIMIPQTGGPQGHAVPDNPSIIIIQGDRMVQSEEMKSLRVEAAVAKNTMFSCRSESESKSARAAQACPPSPSTASTSRAS